jgi:hypothetical protein
MAGTIVADTLTHSTAGSLTTDYVVNGAAKSWQRTTVTGGTPSVIESLNNSSVTDDGTGNYVYSFTSNMSSASYGAAGNVNEPSGVACINNGTGFGASGYRVYIHDHANTDTDPNFVSNNLFGDLA